MLDGVKTLDVVIADLAREFETPLDKIGPSARDLTRRMLQRGMLIPAPAKDR
jgi:hypothetical protein